MAQKTLKVIPGKCISCGACVSLCPKSFTLDEKDMDAKCIAVNPPKNSDADLKLAIDTCPTNAIVYK